MNIVIMTYLLTILITFGSRAFNKILLTVDLASNTLKVDKDLLKDFSNSIRLFNFQNINHEYFIPFYNVYKSNKELLLYLQDYNYVFNELDNLSIIVPMANFEKREYLSNPSIINLFKVLKRGYKRLHNAKYHKMIDKDEKVIGEVLYEECDDNIIILETYGDFDKMLKSDIVNSIESERQQKIEELKRIKDEIINTKDKQKIKKKII